VWRRGIGSVSARYALPCGHARGASPSVVVVPSSLAARCAGLPPLVLGQTVSSIDGLCWGLGT
jgi:hypothetical protein